MKTFRITNRLAVLATSFLLGAGAPLTASAESLGDALASAYRHSGLLEQNRANLRATDEGVASAMANLRPSLNYSASLGYSVDKSAWSEQLSFVASMTLYSFGSNKIAVDIAKETVLATRATLVDIEQQVLSSAVSAYMDVREKQAVVNLRDNAVRLARQNLRATQDRFEVGEITRTAVSQVEAQLASANAALASAQGDLATAREIYKNVVGHYPKTLSNPPAVRLPVKSADAAVLKAQRNHPSIKALQHRAAASDLAVAVAERGVLPTLSGSASVSIDEDGSSENIGLELSGPIYSGGKISSGIRKAIAERDAARAQLLTASRDIEQSVRANWAMLNVLSAAEQARQSLVRAQRVAYDGVREEADLGASTTLDVLDAEQSLLDAQVGAIQAQIARESQSYGVLQSMGLLTVGHLNLNVPTYDPTAYYNAVKDGPTTYVSPQGEKLDRVLESIGKTLQNN